VYASQAQLGLEAQNNAAEVRLRAERRAGEHLAAMRKHAGGRPPAPSACTGAVGAGVGVGEKPLPAVTGLSEPAPPRRDELHITRRQSSQWQQIAALPEPVFEAHIRTTRLRSKELTTAGALKLARQHREVDQ